MGDVSKPAWAGRTSGRFHTGLTVAETLAGPLCLPLHVLTGERDGPVLGITTTIHGDETLPAMMVRRLLGEIDPARLSGRVAAITVCNPMAMGAFARQTPEQHGKTDLHEVFPGAARGNLTQRMAHAIAGGLLDHVDAHIDYHCGGSGGRLQNRVDFDRGGPDDLRAESLRLARHFGTPMVHENNLAASAVRYVLDRGKPAFNAETSGVYLAAGATEGYLRAGVEGLRNIMRVLGMLDEPPAPPPRQACFGTAHRVEVNPSRGGFLESRFQSPDDLGRPIARGTKLADLIDMYSLEVVEEMVAPVDGHLFFSRYSGAVDAGTKAFALAEDAGIRWLA